MSARNIGADKGSIVVVREVYTAYPFCLVPPLPLDKAVKKKHSPVLTEV